MTLLEHIEELLEHKGEDDLFARGYKLALSQLLDRIADEGSDFFRDGLPAVFIVEEGKLFELQQMAFQNAILEIKELEPVKVRIGRLHKTTKLEKPIIL